MEAAEANDVRAQADLQRYKLLVDKREVSRQIYDQALANGWFARQDLVSGSNGIQTSTLSYDGSDAFLNLGFVSGAAVVWNATPLTGPP